MPERFASGVVIGKFHPFHSGHRHLIDAALEQCDRVLVIVCARADQPLPGELRVDWISKSVPSAKVVLVDQDATGLEDDDTAGWAELTIEAHGGPPAAVFTSESYGDAYAAALGAAHISVDPGRLAFPVSGTAVSADPLASLALLPAEVRSSFARRVCVLGAESTGKTTVAEGLAGALGTIWLPEYGRPFTELERPPGSEWASDDFLHIARIQGWFEDFLAGQADRVLVCDTDLFVTARFHDVYLKDPAPTALEEAAALRHYDVFLLCDLGTPFRQDRGQTRRDGPQRTWMHEQYLAYVEGSGRPWVLLDGDRHARLAQALAAVEQMEAKPLDLAQVGADALARIRSARLLTSSVSRSARRA